jgi:hypothetical protein
MNKGEALTAVLARSAVDREFRRDLLIDPQAALKSALGMVFPAGFRIRFIERHADVDALVVLPDFKGIVDPDEIDDGALECVSGGGDDDYKWSEEP